MGCNGPQNLDPHFVCDRTISNTEKQDEIEIRDPEIRGPILLAAE